jgi:regulator of protease activity HflC (stomatin/prohibitin superfamily)
VSTETKTADNVTVTVRVAVQYKVIPNKVLPIHTLLSLAPTTLTTPRISPHLLTKVEAAFYKLTNPQHQIKSYVDDVVRSTLPKMKLDEVSTSLLHL